MKWLTGFISRHVADVLAIAGAACLVKGLYSLWPPLAWIAAGLSLIVIALIAALREEGSKRRSGGSSS